MPNVSLQGISLSYTANGDPVYNGPATLVLNVSEGATLSYTTIQGGAVNDLGLTEVEFSSQGGSNSTHFEVGGVRIDPTSTGDETYVGQLNTASGPITFISHWDESEQVDYLFFLSSPVSMPTNQAGVDALNGSVQSGSLATGTYAPNTPFDPTAISGVVIAQNDVFVGSGLNELYNGGAGMTTFPAWGATTP